MEYVRENVFRIKNYSFAENVQVVKEGFLQKIFKHKIISVAFVAFFTFSSLNLFLIYNFINLLQQIN